MKKKIFTVILSFTIAVSTIVFMPIQTFADDESFYQDLVELISQQDDSDYFGSMELVIGSNAVKVDNRTVMSDVVPQISSNRTMLPIRIIAETAGFDVSFDNASKTVTLSDKSGTTVKCLIGADYINKDGISSSIDAPAYISDNRTYLPIRAIGEALNMEITWEQETKTVGIIPSFQTARLMTIGSTNSMGANKVLTGNEFNVLQFNTPAEAKNAYDSLKASGITVSPDRYIPPINDIKDSSSNVNVADNHMSWGYEDCKFPTYIDSNRNKFKSVTVAVVDTGVSEVSYLKNSIISGYDFVDGDSRPNDENGHGTHVSGTIIDCSGGSGASPVRIMPVRVLNANGSGYNTTVANGINYAANHNADIINMSLGGIKGSNDVLDSVISAAISKGSTVVVAAGNESGNTNNYCPSHIDIPGMLVISAGDKNHNNARFTNYGNSVDLQAPGVSIKSVVPNGGTETWNGTSMACPHVASAAALIKSVEGGNPSKIEQRLRKATSNSGTWIDKYKGCGFLDMSKIVENENPSPEQPSPEKPNNPPKKEITAYEYSKSKFDLKVGSVDFVSAFAIYSDGSKIDITESSGLKSSDTSIVVVDSDGTIKALKAGKAYIQMTNLVKSETVDVADPIVVTVEDKLPAELEEITFDVDKLELEKGESKKIKVTGHYSDGSTKDISSDVNLDSSDNNVVSVSRTTITANDVGKCYIRLTNIPQEVSVPDPITVNVVSEEDTYTELYWGLSDTRIDNDSVSLSAGSRLQIDVYGITSSGKTNKITEQCELKSGDTEVVTITSSGKLEAVGKGETYITIKKAPNPGCKLPPFLIINVN